MNKLTPQEWMKLSREEQKQALIEFREPNPLPVLRPVDVNRLDYERFK